MITAREKGRQLELIVGGGDDTLTFSVPPVPADIGAQLLADFVGVAFGSGETDIQDQETARSMAQTAIGDEVFSQLGQLRWAEQEALVNCAFMWNVQGGGIALVNEYLAGGLPKARETLLRAAGLWDVVSLLQTSLNLASESPTSTDASPATTTPSGGDSPSA